MLHKWYFDEAIEVWWCARTMAAAPYAAGCSSPGSPGDRRRAVDVVGARRGRPHAAVGLRPRLRVMLVAGSPVSLYFLIQSS